MIIYWMMFIFPALLTLMPGRATTGRAGLVWASVTTALVLIIGFKVGYFGYAFIALWGSFVHLA